MCVCVGGGGGGVGFGGGGERFLINNNWFVNISTRESNLGEPFQLFQKLSLLLKEINISKLFYFQITLNTTTTTFFYIIFNDS